MQRYHLFEIHESRWCPAEVRDTVTDLLQFSIRINHIFEPIEKRLALAVDRSGSQKIIDLCSGGGGPWTQLHSRLNAMGCNASVCLTDKYPNVSAFARLRELSRDRVDFVSRPVDATRPPEELDGFRTLFTSFHHFNPGAARRIIADAVERRQGIAIFEFTRRDPLSILSMLLSFAFALFVVPLLKPFRWSRLFWTYLVPLVPLVLTIDGIVSCLRTYSVAELKEFVAEHSSYHWEIGEASGSRWRIPVTYLIGYPAARLDDELRFTSCADCMGVVALRD